MGDEQGTATAVPVTVDLDHPAIRAELRRLIEVISDRGRQSTGYAIMRAAIPGMTPVRWRELAGPRYRHSDGELLSEVRTCRCDHCHVADCTGDCEPCDDHDCEQCSPCDGTYSCCGYCPDCESHPGDERDQVCSLGHCHECEHRCTD